MLHISIGQDRYLQKHLEGWEREKLKRILEKKKNNQYRRNHSRLLFLQDQDQASLINKLKDYLTKEEIMLGIAESVIGVAGKVLDKFVEDKDLKTKLSHELKSQIVSLDLAQAQTNLEQAKHPSIFVAGARPAIMWICAFGLGWQFVFQPVAVWIIAVGGIDVVLPIIETEGLLSLTLALLGLGGMRSFEKSKGIQRNNMKK